MMTAYLCQLFSNRHAYLNHVIANETGQPKAHCNDENGVGPSGICHSDDENDDDDDSKDLGNENDLTRDKCEMQS